MGRSVALLNKSYYIRLAACCGVCVELIAILQPQMPELMLSSWRLEVVWICWVGCRLLCARNASETKGGDCAMTVVVTMPARCWCPPAAAAVAPCQLLPTTAPTAAAAHPVAQGALAAAGHPAVAPAVAMMAVAVVTWRLLPGTACCPASGRCYSGCGRTALAACCRSQAGEGGAGRLIVSGCTTCPPQQLARDLREACVMRQSAQQLACGWQVGRVRPARAMWSEQQLGCR